MHVLNFFRDDDDYQAAIFAADEWRAAEIWEAIAERFWLVVNGYLHQPVPDGAGLVVWSIVWFEPAHRYALQREEEVTGWRQIAQTPPRDHNPVPAWVLRDPRVGPFFQAQQQLWNVVFPNCPPNSEWEWRFESRGRGSNHPGRRRVLVQTQCLQPARVIEEPIPPNPPAPGPLGAR